jgi:magnesium chelatase family protein
MILIASMNPCPCGWNGDSDHECSCSANEIKRYTKKISGPLLDRIDIHIQVPRVEYKDLVNPVESESSESIRARVEAARQRQTERLVRSKIFCNAQMSHAMLKKMCPLTDEAQNLLKQIFEKMRLSARSYDRIIKVSRTIADLDGADTISDRHVAEAIQLRNDVGMNGKT